jgi:hypothetical protein
MNVNEFFEKHSIEEINQKTKISPISLKYIKNKEFDKFSRVKFIGFIRLIEKKFNVDLSDIIEEYDDFYKENQKEEKKEDIEVKKDKKYLLALILILFIISAFLYFKFLNKKVEVINETNFSVYKTNILDKNETNKTKDETIEKNESSNKIVTQENKLQENNNSLSVIKLNNNNEVNKTVNVIEKNVTKEYNITIIPHKKIWFRAINIDNNRSKEFLISHVKILKGNYYIKFGHGFITVLYNDFNITPNTKKIVRILFKDGNYTFLKRYNEYEK